jgi:hypothetical protein
MTVTSDTITAALRVTRENCALLAEALIAAGRSSEVGDMIRRGISPARIPPLSEPAPQKQPAQAVAGFDEATSKRRFEEQTRRHVAPP